MAPRTLLLVLLLATWSNGVLGWVSRTGRKALTPRRQGRTPRSRVVVASWGQDVAWGAAKITENAPAGTDLRTIKFDSQDLLSGYDTPGMFCQLKPEEDAKPGFFAFACAPGDSNGGTELLVKRTDSNGWLVDAKPGDELMMSGAMGKGFKVQEALSNDDSIKNVLLVCAGTGVAPLRAVIESGVLGLGEGGRTCSLYFGARNSEGMPYQDKFSEWEAAGVRVVPVLSKPEDSWAGATGYVQKALAADGVSDPESTVALLCGMKEMAEEVTAHLTSEGVPAERILLNF
mmetsp:Transcript_8892/g.25396  ORF Transcript_8892/g.25396 Transcript_8892/m.25396 type:complete len:288 (-) Transcript_8892:192-1055(-)